MKGVFRTLFQYIVDTATKDPLGKGVRLYVELENYTAQSVYEKFGMTKLDDWNFDEKDLVFEHH